MLHSLILAPSVDATPLVVPATDARRQLSDFCTDSLDVSSALREIGFDGPGKPCAETHALFYLLSRDATVSEAYRSLATDLRDIAFTPEQLGEFVARHRDHLHERAHSFFFLLREGDEIASGICVPYKSRYFAIRMYVLDSVYVVRAKDMYGFLVRES